MMSGSSLCRLYQYVLILFSPFQIRVLNHGQQVCSYEEEKSLGENKPRKKLAAFMTFSVVLLSLPPHYFLEHLFVIFFFFF